MSQYLLSVHTVVGETREPMSPEEMQASMERISTLEAEMEASGTFVFSARLHDPDTATVVRRNDGEVVMTDGPFAESKEHIAGFYIINGDDLDAALAWAGRVVGAINAPIEVRPFFDTRGA